ncbi:hypothetical protein M2277_002887 [Paenibacillus sp. LBL]|nr:hypothetical protein [Paenibacillus sp. LBL]
MLKEQISLLLFYVCNHGFSETNPLFKFYTGGQILVLREA